MTKTNNQTQTETVLIDTVGIGELHKINGSVHPESGEHITPMEAAKLKADEMGAYLVYITLNHEDVASHNSKVTRQKGRADGGAEDEIDYRVAIVAKIPDEGQKIMHRIFGNVPQRKTASNTNPNHANPFEK